MMNSEWQPKAHVREFKKGSDSSRIDTTQNQRQSEVCGTLDLMSRVEQVEEAIQAMEPEELAEFRAWFAEYDWGLWDQQLERDAPTGRLDHLADEALRDHTAGNTTPL